MKQKLSFETSSAPNLLADLRSGLRAYAIDLPKIGPPTSLWLLLGNGNTLRVTVEMHDLIGWHEIGTLIFQTVNSKPGPKMTQLSSSWSRVQDLQFLVYDSDDCEAECGFALSSTGGRLVVVPGADICTLAIDAPFLKLPFNPENDLKRFRLKSA